MQQIFRSRCVKGSLLPFACNNHLTLRCRDELMEEKGIEVEVCNMITITSRHCNTPQAFENTLSSPFHD